MKIYGNPANNIRMAGESHTHNTAGRDINSHPGAFTLPCALTISSEFARFLDVKDKTLANAF
jgi:hypothetical protein